MRSNGDTSHSTDGRAVCFICGAPGATLYAGLHDQLYGARGEWRLLHCGACAIAWLDPQPSDLGDLYAEYYTHHGGAARGWLASLRHRTESLSLLGGKLLLGYAVSASRIERWAARILTWTRPGREMAQTRFAMLAAPPNGRILEIGCGNGTLLASLRDVGWQVTGIELDAQAVQVARTWGLEVHLGTIHSARLQPGAFKVIILNHVLEHVPDPLADLRECRRLLGDDGTIVVLTPNLNGFGHKWFGRHWRGLEIPRHLFIFSPNALLRMACMVGLIAEQPRTLVRGARFIYIQSSRIRAGLTRIESRLSTGLVERVLRLGGSYLFQGMEWASTWTDQESGDEILVCLRAPASTTRL